MTTLQCKKNHRSVHHVARLPGKVRIVGAEAGWPPVKDCGDRGTVLS